MILLFSTKNPIIDLIVVALIFVFVLAVTYFTTRWIGSYQRKHMSRGNIQVLEGTRLANNKSLEIVKVGDKCFLIAICRDSVTTIGEINEESLIIEEPMEKPAEKQESFGSVFSRFKVNHKDVSEDEEEKEE